MKRLLCYIVLLAVVSTTLFSSIGPITVSSKEEGADLDAQKQGVHFVTAEEAADKNIGGAYGVKEGDLLYITINQKAQSNIKYQTAGWMIRKDAVCSDRLKPTKESRLSATCSPTADGKVVELPKDAFFEFDPENYPVAGQPMHVKNVVKMESEVFNEFLKKELSFVDTENGDIIYFSTILQVNRRSALQFPVHKTLQGIRSAESWANRSGFRQYYDMPVEFVAAPQNATIKKRLASNMAVELEKDVLDNNNKNGYIAGKPIKQVVIPDKIKSSITGKDYKLVCSFVRVVGKPLPSGCGDTGGAPYYVRSDSTLTRQPTMDKYGIEVFELYKETEDPSDCNCSQAIFIPGQSTIGGKVETSKIGKKVPVQIKMKE
ncbi:hypothetical protein, partial [Paenibacillus sinopodophylli]|uniref:hypothetical protein n=1 Tax=Paenibacillus sinopodophylli TaxID=1837342 RepID=UPI00110CEAEF